ncbi:MAG: hypothetical protein IT379_05595, partial [Deltaproteobacteria bacterium]|nr:hypothetical protein [Deltaproteobacteria bacterium]
MTQCLDDATLEALAHGRRDLVPEGALEHARGCARCAAELEDARALSTAFGAHLPDPAVLDEAELSALVSRALDTGQRDSQAARARLLLSTLACALAAGALGVSSIALSWPRANELLTAARDGLAVASAFRRVLALLPEETSFVAFGLALVVLAAGALWARANARRASSGAAAIASLVVLSAGLSYASDAFALDLRGSWDDAPRVSVELERRSRSEALQAVARAASLDLVASLPDEGPPVEVHVRNAPLADVLRAILGDGPFVVERTGSLLVVRVAEPSEPGADAGSVTALPRGGAAGDRGTEPTPTPSSGPMPDAGGTPQDVAGSAPGAPTSTTTGPAVPSAPSIVPLPALPPIPPMPTLPGAGTPPAPVPAWVGDRIARGGDVLV